MGGAVQATPTGPPPTTAKMFFFFQKNIIGAENDLLLGSFHKKWRSRLC